MLCLAHWPRSLLKPLPVPRLPGASLAQRSSLSSSTVWLAARGMFSNESGLGSAAIAAAAAQTSHPVRQGLVSMTQTFIDTIIVVSFTGLVIITTGTWSQVDPETGEQLPAALMTGEAFSYGLPGQ